MATPVRHSVVGKSRRIVSIGFCRDLMGSIERALGLHGASGLKSLCFRVVADSLDPKHGKRGFGIHSIVITVEPISPQTKRQGSWLPAVFQTAVGFLMAYITGSSAHSILPMRS